MHVQKKHVQIMDIMLQHLIKVIVIIGYHYVLLIQIIQHVNQLIHVQIIQVQHLHIMIATIG